MKENCLKEGFIKMIFKIDSYQNAKYMKLRNKQLDMPNNGH